MLVVRELQERRQRRPQQQLLRIGGSGAGRQHRERAERGHRQGRLMPGASREHRREANPVRNVEDLELSRRSEVCVDEQRAHSQLREQHGEVGGHVAAPLERAGTGDRQRARLALELRPLNQELRPERPQLLGVGVARVAGGGEIRPEGIAVERHVWEVILPGES